MKFQNSIQLQNNCTRYNQRIFKNVAICCDWNAILCNTFAIFQKYFAIEDKILQIPISQKFCHLLQMKCIFVQKNTKANFTLWLDFLSFFSLILWGCCPHQTLAGNPKMFWFRFSKFFHNLVTKSLLKFDRFSWTKYGKRRPQIES